MDLNADLGESWYDKVVGNDAALMPFLDSCNLACGFHGGDASTQRRTLDLALEHGVRIGAHPSFPDRKHFGREVMKLSTEALKNLLIYQVAGLQGLATAAGTRLTHLKPHGALYHYANQQGGAAGAVVTTAAVLDIPIIYGPPSGELRKACEAAGLEFWPEGFADRVYEPTLHLRSRQLPHHSIAEPEAAAEQVRSLVQDGRVRASDGLYYPLAVRTICLHGDHAGAVKRARAVREMLRPG